MMLRPGTCHPSGWLALWLAVALAGCQGREPEPLTFRFHLPEAPATLDPAKAGDRCSLGVVDRLFDGLMRLDRVRDVPESEMAESYTVSADGGAAEQTLRKSSRRSLTESRRCWQ